jgi:hypothetical protein
MRQNNYLEISVRMGGHYKHIYIYTPRSCPQKGDWNEFIDTFILLPISIHELILQNLHGKTTIWSLQNYFLYINCAKLYQYRKWLLVIVCVLIFTQVDKVIATNHIMNMKDEKNI